MNDYEKEHLAKLRGHLAECTVLLKSNGAFPLEKPCRIAAYGSGVRRTVKGGTGSGDVNSRFSVTVEQALRDAGFTMTTAAWLDAYDAAYAETRKGFVKEIQAKAKQMHTHAALLGMGAVMPEPEYHFPLDGDGDCAIYVVSRICGEGNDRKAVAGDLLLTASEIRDILALDQKYAHFMLVLNVGGPVDVSPVADVGNILILSQLGSETGNVLTDILLGKANPSGKLAATWAAAKDYCPDMDFGGMDDTYYNEGIYVGYRYFDRANVKALFPFGYGGSFTEFSVKTDGVSVEGTVITTRAAVTNIGKYSGKETVQLYLSAPGGKLDKPYQELAAFAKTKQLAPQESDILRPAFDLTDLASYDAEQQQYILEQGDYILRAGTSSVDTAPIAVLHLDGAAVTRKVHSITPGKATPDKVYNARPAESIPQDVPQLTIHAADIPCETAQYDAEETILPEAEKLSDEELAFLNIGRFVPKGGAASMVGNAARTVCGAAGETSDVLKDRGVPLLVMADGPAGLRLENQFYRDAKGTHPLGQSALIASLEEFMPAPLRVLSHLVMGGKKAPKGVKIEEQYTTAIPIGTAIAQSWNTDFAQECGGIVGEEMQRFGVHLWLAPALNIQRSPLCGRNFEYYSEDPLISGKFAAAITRGVQKHPGCGVTIKHFAANNQETNRVNRNSQISERALREIYLRGFALCIRESQPAAVMTSYNLINGTHTAEHRGLIHDYLRSECGFKGIVMTDWIVQGNTLVKNPKYPQTSSPKIAAAGGDVMMPGGQADYDKLLQAIKSGGVSRKQMQANASRMMAAAKRLGLKDTTKGGTNP